MIDALDKHKWGIEGNNKTYEGLKLLYKWGLSVGATGRNNKTYEGLKFPFLVAMSGDRHYETIRPMRD